MKTFIKTISPEMKIISFSTYKKFEKPSKIEIAERLIDSFNNQICFSDKYKQKFEMLINDTEFAYPNDAVKIRTAFDIFIESSHQLLGDYIDKAFDLDFIESHEGKSIVKSKRKFNPIDKVMEFDVNEYWTNDWIDQIAVLKNDSIDNSSEDKYFEDYYCYDNVSEMNFVL